MAKTLAKTKAGKQRKVSKVMKEFKAGRLRSASGQKVRNPKQAIAIALSEAKLSKEKGFTSHMIPSGPKTVINAPV